MPPTTVRFDEDVRKALEAQADAQERSVSWVANKALREHFGLESTPKAKKAK